MSEKPMTAAETFIMERRIRFPQLYPTDFHFMLCMLRSDSYRWDKDGLIEPDHPDLDSPVQVTEDGWKSLRYGSRCPTSWPKPNPSSPILNIPDNAERSWLNEIGMFLHTAQGWNPEHVKTWIRTATQLSGVVMDFQLAQIDRNISGYEAVVAALRERQVAERVVFVQNLSFPQSEVRPKVEVGATVRFHTGVDEAVVLLIQSIPGSRFSDSGSVRLVTLNATINGSNVHVIENLVATKFPAA